MVLKSSDSDATLRFGPIEDDYIAVSLSASSYSGRHRTYLHTDAPHIASFFSEAAENWRNWDGVREWSSLEGDVQLTLEADRLGHITLKVRIIGDSGGRDPWQLTATLALEAGQLEGIANDARRHFIGPGI